MRRIYFCYETFSNYDMLVYDMLYCRELSKGGNIVMIVDVLQLRCQYHPNYPLKRQ